MKKLILGAVVLSLGLVAGLVGGSNIVRAEGELDVPVVPVCSLDLVSKNKEWQIDVEGASGVMDYDHDSLTVEASGLDPRTYYVLIEYPEVAPNPWPAGGWSVISIVSGETNDAGNLALSADYSIKAGEKYWVVKSNTISDEGKMDVWYSGVLEILFEHNLIEDNSCLVEPTPTSGPAVESESHDDSYTPWTPSQSIPSAPQCYSQRPSLGVANINVVRTSDSTALVQWSLHSGDDTHIIYGETGEGWKHAGLNMGISGEAIIGGLVVGRTYDWQVIPMNGCAAGDRSPVVTNI